MGKMRKPAPAMYAPKSQPKEEEVKLDFKLCCNCGKTIEAGYYGRWGDGGVCSKKCNSEYETKQEKLRWEHVKSQKPSHGDS